jgi:hypothetical protein
VPICFFFRSGIPLLSLRNAAAHASKRGSWLVMSFSWSSVMPFLSLLFIHRYRESSVGRALSCRRRSFVLVPRLNSYDFWLPSCQILRQYQLLPNCYTLRSRTSKHQQQRRRQHLAPRSSFYFRCAGYVRIANCCWVAGCGRALVCGWVSGLPRGGR